MALPITKLRKDQLIKLSKMKCRHSHSYLDHYACYAEEQPEGYEAPERIGFWDIESSNLKADYGQMLSWAIKDGASDDVYYDAITAQDIRDGIEDKRILQSCVDTLRQFDRIVTYYGSIFDAPFTRTRAMIMGVEFPTYGEVFHTDAYMIARSKINLSSRRLENICRQILGYTQKTRIEPPHWRGGMRGDKKALEYIVDHNIKDVIDLESIYLQLAPYVKGGRTSL